MISAASSLGFASSFFLSNFAAYISDSVAFPFTDRPDEPADLAVVPAYADMGTLELCGITASLAYLLKS